MHDIVPEFLYILSGELSWRIAAAMEQKIDGHTSRR